MNRKIILTGDGSHTVAVPELKVTYHSVHGAIQESQHVFIQAGLHASERYRRSDALQILEVGFGTGLNALLTMMEADQHRNRICYTAIDLFPLNETEHSQLNYCQQLNAPQYQRLFEKMHQCDWGRMFEITEHFRLTKIKCDLFDFTTEDPFILIYFDAFAPNAQPELWTKEVFEKLYAMLLPGGILVTYCSKGEVRRNMIAAGFEVEKLPGPPCKREMVRAKK